jgi:uncharacterized protein YkwD
LSASYFDDDREQNAHGYRPPGPEPHPQWPAEHGRFAPAAQPPEPGERLWLSTRILLAIAVVIGVLAVASAVGAFTFAGRNNGVGEAAITSGPDQPVPVASDPALPTPSTEPESPSATPSPVPTNTGATGPTIDPVAAAEAEVLTLVNRERARAGCRALAVDTRLATAAGRHSADMARRGYFSHTTPEGVTFSTRITNAGYRWSFVGENIALGQRTPAAVMRAWMTSPGHRANILNCRFRHIGVGLAYDARRVPYWTQDFGTPLS